MMNIEENKIIYIQEIMFTMEIEQEKNFNT